MSKTVIYQILPRLWGDNGSEPVPNGSYQENGCGKFSSLDDEFLGYLKTLGVTHIWLTGIIRHASEYSCPGCSPSQVRKGRAGSPYAIVDYYDVNPYLADIANNRIDEFKLLLNRVHSSGLKAVIDFVPNHVGREYGSLGLSHPEYPVLGAGDDPSVHWKPENDFYYYPSQMLSLPVDTGFREMPAKASGNCFSPAPGINDWWDTIRLNYCDFHTSTWDRMLHILRYWAGMGVDGFRCDMVEMVPPEFFTWMIPNLKRDFPEVELIAEVYDRNLYDKYLNQVGFDILYDKSGLYDTLRAIVVSGASAKGITGNWQGLGALQPRMLNFLENHDEVRFASDSYAGDAMKAFAPLAVSLLWNKAPFMIYSGEEIGERGTDAEGFSGRDGRTSIFDWWSPASFRRLNDYIHHGKGLEDKESHFLDRFRSVMSLASSPVFSEGSSYDLCWCNDHSPGFNPDRHFAFLRSYGGKSMLVAANFSSDDTVMRLEIPSDATGSGSCVEEISVPAWDFACKQMFFH